jgi:diguanylate cyclase (GGDEF)-like protein
MKMPRFSDIPLVLKIGVAPGFALVMLVLLSAGVLRAQYREVMVLDGVVRYDNVRSRLEVDSKRITAANGALYEILAKQANGGSPEESQKALASVLHDVDAVQADLATLRPDLPQGELAAFDHTRAELQLYRGAIQVLGAMLSVDFSTAADFIQPYERNYTRITRPLETVSKHINVESAAIAGRSRREADTIVRFTVIFVAATCGAVLLVAAAVILAVRRTVAAISRVTESLAAGHIDLDLDALKRNDEFGAIIRSLVVFQENQRRIITMRAERKDLEARQHEALRKVQCLAENDELTGLLNRRAMVPLLQRALQARAVRRAGESLPTQLPLCLAILDIDHFKAINDEYGHLAGDEVLRVFAQVCTAGLRSGDVLARWGGEEFVLMLPDSTIGRAVQCIERLRAVMAETPFDRIKPGLRVTFSAGVTLVQLHDTMESAIARADNAMYGAKHAGRDRVVVAELAA